MGSSNLARPTPVVDRPHCFGAGRDPFTGQYVPLRVCRACPVAVDCATFRIALSLERHERVGDDYAAIYLRSRFPYGLAADRFSKGRSRG